MAPYKPGDNHTFPSSGRRTSTMMTVRTATIIALAALSGFLIALLTFAIDGSVPKAALAGVTAAGAALLGLDKIVRE